MSYVDIKITDIHAMFEDGNDVPTVVMEGMVSINMKKQFCFSLKDTNALTFAPSKEGKVVPEILKNVKQNIVRVLEAYMAGIKQTGNFRLVIEDELCNRSECELEDN